jgi:DNA-directed RNA polymerase subunit RPC12/RpoP
MYLVIVCYNCGQLLLAKAGQKTRRCPYCETRLVLHKAKNVAHTKTAQEASSLIRALKRKNKVGNASKV